MLEINVGANKKKHTAGHAQHGQIQPIMWSNGISIDRLIQSNVENRKGANRIWVGHPHDLGAVLL